MIKSIFLFLLVCCFFYTDLYSQSKLPQPNNKVTFHSEANARLSYGVSVPANRKLYIISGIVPSLFDSSAIGRNQYGDTKQQAINVLEKIGMQLNEQGLTLKDVVYLRAFVGPDPLKDKAYDFAGWNAAYDLYFNNLKNPVKPGRATIGAQLVSSDFLIEVEGLAVYPEKNHQ